MINKHCAFIAQEDDFKLGVVTDELCLPRQGVVVVWEWEWVEDRNSVITHVSETEASIAHVSETSLAATSVSDETNCATNDQDHQQ